MIPSPFASRARAFVVAVGLARATPASAEAAVPGIPVDLARTADERRLVP